MQLKIRSKGSSILLLMVMFLMVLFMTAGCRMFTPPPPSVSITFDHPEMGHMEYKRSGEQKLQNLNIQSDKVDVSLESQEVKDTVGNKAMDAVNSMLSDQSQLIKIITDEKVE